MKNFLLGRMFTPGFRFFAALAVLGLIGAFLTGFSTCFPADFNWGPPEVVCKGEQGFIDALLGPLTGGYKGGIGNHFAYGSFLGLAVVSGFLAGLSVAYRDADNKSLAEVAHTETAPMLRPPRHASYWPLIGALSAGTLLVGWVIEPVLFLAGALGLIVTVLEWTVRAWAENATGDPNVNEEYRRRMAVGFEVPGIALLAIGVLVLSGSRVLLTVSELAAVAVAGVVAFVLLAAFAAVAYYPRVNRSVVSIFVVLAGIIVIGSGIFSAAVGEREIETHHLEEHGETPAEAEEEGGSREGQEELEGDDTGAGDEGDTGSTGVTSGDTGDTTDTGPNE